jgi:O-antigen ligase
MVGIGMSAALSGSRGTFLGLIAVVFTLLFSLRQVSVAKRVGFVVTIVVALVLVAPPGYWDQMNTLKEPTEDYNWDSNYGRRKVWLRGLEYMWSNPLTGVGINNFRMAEGLISDPAINFSGNIGERIKWSAAHNSFIQVGSEMGVQGLIVWSSLILGGLVGMQRLRRRLPDVWARGDPEQRFLYAATMYLPVSLVGFTVTASFVSFAYIDPIYVLSAYLAGTYVSIDGRLSFDSSRRHQIGTAIQNRPESRPETAGVLASPARASS